MKYKKKAETPIILSGRYKERLFDIDIHRDSELADEGYEHIVYIHKGTKNRMNNTAN